MEGDQSSRDWWLKNVYWCCCFAVSSQMHEYVRSETKQWSVTTHKLPAATLFVPRHKADVCLFRAGNSISSIVCIWIRFGFQFSIDCGSRRTHIYTNSEQCPTQLWAFALIFIYFFNRRFYHIRGPNPIFAHQITTQLIQSKVKKNKNNNVSCILFLAVHFPAAIIKYRMWIIVCRGWWLASGVRASCVARYWCGCTFLSFFFICARRHFISSFHTIELLNCTDQHSEKSNSIRTNREHDLHDEFFFPFTFSLPFLFTWNCRHFFFRDDKEWCIYLFEKVFVRFASFISS